MLDGNANTGVKGHQLKTPLHYAKTPSIVNFLIKNVTNGMDPYNKTLNKEDVNRSNCNVRTDVQVAKYMSLDDTLERCKCIDNSVDTLGETEFKAEYVGRNSMFGTLLQRNDEAAIALLDEHITYTGSNIKSKGSLIVYDFTVFQKEASDPEASADPQNIHTNNDFAAHLKMIKTDSKAFEHPLSTAFVNLQTNLFNPFLPFILIRSFLLVFSLSMLVMWQEHLLLGNSNMVHNDTSFSNITMFPKKDNPNIYWTHMKVRFDHTEDLFLGSNEDYRKIVFYCLFASVCVSTLLIVHREVEEAYYNFKRYCNNYENILEIALILSTVAYLVLMIFSEVDSVKHASAWSVFFAWIETLLMIKRIPKFGTYIIMFFNVSKTLLEKLLLFIPGMIAFSFAFYVLPHVQDSPFHGIISSFMKSFVMMTGEIGFEDYFEWQKTKETNSEGSTQILLLIFVVFFCIVLVNLLVGLAVSELQKEIKLATKHYNCIAVEEIGHFWKNSHKSIYLIVLKKLCRCFRRTNGDKNTCVKKLIGPTGIFKSIRNEWKQTGLKECQFSWKICIEPNEGVYSEDSNSSTSTNKKTYAVYFFDNHHNKRFEEINQDRNKKGYIKKYLKTGLFLSHSIVDDTINWLNQKEVLPSNKSYLVPEKLDSMIAHRDKETKDAYKELYKNHYLARYENFMKELDAVYSEFIDGNKEAVEDAETLRKMPLFRNI